jgi:endothelin-converting enzyme
MKQLILVAASVTFALGLTACNDTKTTQVKAEATAQAHEAMGATQTLNSGIETANFDNAVRPQDDFYRYVDGSWLKNTEIPADRSNYGSFTQLFEAAQIKLREIIERTAADKNAKPGSDEQKLGDFYNSYMNEALVETLGLKPLEGQLQKISGLSSINELTEAFAYFNNIGVTTPFRWDVDNDEKSSSEYIVGMYQGGLGLPDRDYYFKDSDKFNKIRVDYAQYITDLLALIKHPNPADAAKRIVTLETAMAKSQWTRVQRRDPVAGYNKLSIAELDKLMGKMNWASYAKTAHLQDATQVVVRQPSYISGLAKTIADTAIVDWQDYLTFHLVNGYADTLSKDFADLNFAFFDKRLRGLDAPSPRWKSAVDATDSAVGEILGKLYVKETFSPQAKTRMETMVKNLMKAYSKRINTLEWMSEQTKKAAQDKLSKFTYKIGYPDKWKDYSALEIKADDLVGNTMRYSQWDHKRQSNRLGKPINKTAWYMTPQTVNAYYNPVMNEIVFPAAILQPPFFNMDAEDAVNYGGIGAVIGHELGHGFDDSGAQYDGEGNLRDWWSAADKAEFEKRGTKFSHQFSQFKPFPDAAVNGDLTLGENIGDLGGLTVALEAYHLSLGGKSAPAIEGFSGDERFFFGWAQVWRRKYREEALRQRLLTDSHSPSEYRVNGILWNMPEFYETFKVVEGDKMYLKPEDRVTIW